MCIRAAATTGRRFGTGIRSAWRVKLRRSRSARPRHHLWRKGVALRSADGTSADRRAEAAARTDYRVVRVPIAFFAAQPAQAVARVERIMANHERRSELGANRS